MLFKYTNPVAMIFRHLAVFSSSQSSKQPIRFLKIWRYDSVQDEQDSRWFLLKIGRKKKKKHELVYFARGN